MNLKSKVISGYFVNQTKTFKVVALFLETIRYEQYKFETRLKLIFTGFYADKNEATTIT